MTKEWVYDQAHAQVVEDGEMGRLVAACVVKSDASLIVAAPDLLAACEAVLLADGEEWETGKRVLRAAVEKAKGVRP